MRIFQILENYHADAEKVIFAFMNGLQTTQNFIFSRHDARIVMIESHVIPVVNSAKEVSPHMGIFLILETA
jgi:hypothetical protein